MAGADSVRVRAYAHLDARLTPRDPAPVALALSGGGDSLALLRLAADWCAAAGRPLLALTVDHRLSPDAPAWTAFAACRARAAGAAWRAVTWTGSRPERGLPAAARAARHRLLAEAARAAGARVVLLGHTADDVTEGERMRQADAPTLGRLRAWGPSPVWPEGRGLALLRPLLDVGRAELRAWLPLHGEADWVDDPANDDLASPRARARRRGGEGAPAPVPPRPDVSRLAGAARIEASGRVSWSRADLHAASPQARTRALAAAAVCVGGGSRTPRASRAAALADSAMTGHGVRTLAGARLSAGADGMVELCRAVPREPAAPEALLPGEPHLWSGRFEMTADTPGWRVAALAGHAARLRAAERARLRAVAPQARAMLPVLLDEVGAPRLPRPFGDAPATALEAVGLRLRLALGAIRTEAELAAACVRDAAPYPPSPPPCRR